MGREAPVLIVLDLMLPDMNSEAVFLQEWKKRGQSMQSDAFSSHSRRRHRRRNVSPASRLGADDFVGEALPRTSAGAAGQRRCSSALAASGQARFGRRA